MKKYDLIANYFGGMDCFVVVRRVFQTFHE